IEARAGITVPVPGAADIRAGLENPRGHAQFAQAVEHIHAGNPGADDDRVVDRKLALAWAFRQDVCVRHDLFPSLRHAAKIHGGPPAVPSPPQDTASTTIDYGSSPPSRQSKQQPNKSTTL